MKFPRLIFILVLFAFMLSAQTIDLGNHVFFNDEGKINIAADANLAVRVLDSPYVPFVLYLGADPRVIATFSRNDITMIHNGKAYNMVDIKELRQEYGQDTRDYRLYERFSKDNLILSRMRFYRFQEQYDFFPPRAGNIRITDEASVSETIGFKTFAYFKNPGFQDGDQIVIQVIDKKKSEIWGATALVLTKVE